jgi:hypothetical protein
MEFSIICQKYKDITEKIYRDILTEAKKKKGHSEDEVRYLLRSKIEEFLKSIGEKIPIFFEERRIDILIKDIVVETKKIGDLSKKSILEDGLKKVKKNMKKHLAPFGVLTDLEKIYIFELKEDGEKIEKIIEGEFNYENFCLLLRFLLGERKRFITEMCLTTDFGYVTENTLIQNFLKKLFYLFNHSNNKKTKLIFYEWQKLFKLSQTTHWEYLQERRRALEKYFEMEINEDNEYKCMFVMHTALSIIIKLLTYNFLSLLKPTNSVVVRDRKSVV